MKRGIEFDKSARLSADIGKVALDHSSTVQSVRSVLNFARTDRVPTSTPYSSSPATTITSPRISGPAKGG
jgi:hypothetical protein